MLQQQVVVPDLKKLMLVPCLWICNLNGHILVVAGLFIIKKQLRLQENLDMIRSLGIILIFQK
ncbi:hypothetical protein D3C86_1838770 [compost metagenome]